MYLYLLLFYNLFIIYIYIYIIYQYLYLSLSLYIYVCGRGATASRLDRATTRRRFTFYQKFLVLIRSISERQKTEMTLKPSSGFELVYEPSYYQI